MILSGSARLAGVFGWPVAHSRSPRLHGFWLDRHRIDGAYVPLPVRPDRFADAVRALRDLGFRGGNVTIPHKEAAFAVCDRVTRRAERAGAVNTLVFDADGTIAGDNTDGWGFLESLRTAIPALDLAGRTAVVLGAGGAARAIAAALLDEGAQVALVNRTPDRAAALARALGGAIAAHAWDAVHALLPAADLLINTTALGMKGTPSPVLPLERLPDHAIVADIVYVPRRTGLLCAAERRGLCTVGGLGMLLHQARPGFAAWFGIDPVVDAELEAFVAADIPETDEAA
ncbi:shikimate dehydrogenase [Elioraea thermophila]|uniref:shikimate dehydrogenase n=1 Tax=Elioraea thermophila TaxID=2185104 RepID=UPI000DF39DE4|nr:shikimate dehydrogenase [Elioraea thermophila]